MTNKPVLIGQCNPLNSDARFALYPFPDRSTGHRLWEMLHERTDCSRRSYIDTFDRRNMMVGRVFDAAEARRQSAGLWESLQGRRVVLLGQALANALWLPRSPKLAWRTDAGVRWCEIPHPSGLNRLYNDEVLREAVGLRLEQLFRDYEAEMAS